MTKSSVLEARKASRELSLHPVHLKPDNDGNLTPSALVPFCSYQGDQKLLGEERQELRKLTLCDKFEPAILEGQLCYSLDVKQFERKATRTGKQSGLLLLLDPNPYPLKSADGKAKTARNDNESFKVYIHTLAPHIAFGPGAYSLHTLKKMTGKTSFYELPDSQKECQVQSIENCQMEMFLKRVETTCACVPWTLAIDNSGREVK